MNQLKDTDWLNEQKKQDPTICCLQEIYFRSKYTCRVEMKGWKKIFHANGSLKRAGVATYIWDKIEFKINSYHRRLRCYMIIKHQFSRKL